MEPKILPASLRQPKRYVVFEIVSEHPITYQDLVNAVWSSTLSFLGEALASEARQKRQMRQKSLEEKAALVARARLDFTSAEKYRRNA